MDVVLKRDPSIIPGAGEGLFAGQDISKDDIVCQYTGIQCSKSEMMELYRQDPAEFISSIHPSARDLDKEDRKSVV